MLAKENGDLEIAQEASVSYGVVNAELKWNQIMQNVLSKINLDGEND